MKSKNKDGKTPVLLSLLHSSFSSLFPAPSLSSLASSSCSPSESPYFVRKSASSSSVFYVSFIEELPTRGNLVSRKRSAVLDREIIESQEEDESAASLQHDVHSLTKEDLNNENSVKNTFGFDNNNGGDSLSEISLPGSFFCDGFSSGELQWVIS